MKTTDMLETDCVRAFDEWVAEENRKTLALDPASLIRRAFVAGYKRGGAAGAKMMHDEALAALRGAVR